MDSKTNDTIIRHLKGIVAALEKEDHNNELDSKTRDCLYETGREIKNKKERDALEKDINNILDGDWNEGNKHRMTIRLPLGVRELGIRTQAILVKIAADRRLEINIESNHARYCIVVFTK